MFHRLRKWLLGKPLSEEDRIASMLSQLNQMKRDLEAGPEQMPLESLRPVLIPSSILEGGNWFGPHHHFPQLPISLTWAFLRPENTMQYLSSDTADKLTAAGKDWRGMAKNAALKDFEGKPWTGELRNPDGSLASIVLNHEDGLGPSRLYCYRQLLGHFPEGFQIFVPARNIAFLLCPTASEKARAELERFVRQVHKEAEVPMSLEPHDHRLIADALNSAGESN